MIGFSSNIGQVAHLSLPHFFGICSSYLLLELFLPRLGFPWLWQILLRLPSDLPRLLIPFSIHISPHAALAELPPVLFPASATSALPWSGYPFLRGL